MANLESGKCSSFTGSGPGIVDAMVFSECGNSVMLHGVMPLAQYPQYPKWSEPLDQPSEEDNNAQLQRLVEEARQNNPAATPQPGKQRYSCQMHFRLKPGKSFDDLVRALSTKPAEGPSQKKRKVLAQQVIK